MQRFRSLRLHPGADTDANILRDRRNRRKALTQGLSAVPPIPEDIRIRIRARMEAEGPETLHAELLARDPSTQLKPADRTRIARALEVLEATGRPLADWHGDGLPPLLDAS